MGDHRSGHETQPGNGKSRSSHTIGGFLIPSPLLNEPGPDEDTGH
jgi:hypothetical protein